MTAVPRFWSALTTTDFDRLDRSRAIAVLPVAATEQHGPHLPLSVDTDLAQGIVQAALDHLPADLPALFLPVQTVGFSPEHAAFAGTLTLKADTVIRLWTEIADCVADAGVRKLLIFNTHGGQVGLLDVVARDLRARRAMLVVSTSWFQLPLLDAQGGDVNERFSPDERRFGAHAGAIETSMMLALAPSQVRIAELQRFDSSSRQRAQRHAILGNGRSARFAWQAQDLHPAGAAGDATAASAATGRALVDAAARSLAALLVEMDHLPPETLRGGGAPKE